MAAAAELAKTGGCNAEDISSVMHDPAGSDKPARLEVNLPDLIYKVNLPEIFKVMQNLPELRGTYQNYGNLPGT